MYVAHQLSHVSFSDHEIDYLDKYNPDICKLVSETAVHVSIIMSYMEQLQREAWSVRGKIKKTVEKLIAKFYRSSKAKCI